MVFLPPFIKITNCLRNVLTPLWICYVVLITTVHATGQPHGVLTRGFAFKVEFMGVSIFRTGHWAPGADSSEEVFSSLENT